MNLDKFKISDSSSDYEHNKKEKLLKHKFYPATFLSITGKSSEDNEASIPEEKKKILDNVFNNKENSNGKFIKIILGSKVMNEGINLFHVSEVHILDVHFTLGKVDQVIGRAIRTCSHVHLANEKNVYPKVNVYKYVVKLKDEMSSEEELYKKAEKKYLLIKKTERLMKEVAIDCPLNISGNIDNDDVVKYKKCTPYKGKNICPVTCDFAECSYICDDKILNNKYYDPNRNIYKIANKNEIDYSTFTEGLARSEIDFSKKKIKELFVTNYMFTVEDIIKNIKNSYKDDKKELFDEFFVFKALDELIPITENDFNNFKDPLIDKHNEYGYLIYRNKYYIFQPFSQNEDVPIHYRSTFNKKISEELSLYNYLKKNTSLVESTDSEISSNQILIDETNLYNFEDGIEYYENRNEFFYVGIIDKELSRRKNKKFEDMNDVFKIREKRNKILEKKRGTGIPTLKGAVCSTSKDKSYLEKIAKKLNINTKNINTRNDICELIKYKMYIMEKYSVGKDKLTYLIVPTNHPNYKFPINLEDRIKFIQNDIKKNINVKLDIKTTKIKKKDGKEKGNPSYILDISSSSDLLKFKKFLSKYTDNIKSKKVVINID